MIYFLFNPNVFTELIIISFIEKSAMSQPAQPLASTLKTFS